MNHFQARASEVGRLYEDRCAAWLSAHGFSILGRKTRHESGIELDILARDGDGELVGIECKGGDRDRPGLLRSDNRWKVLGQTLALLNWNRSQHPAERLRFLVLTSAQPTDDAEAAESLRIAEALGQLTIVAVANEES